MQDLLDRYAIVWLPVLTTIIGCAIGMWPWKRRLDELESDTVDSSQRSTNDRRSMHESYNEVGMATMCEIAIGNVVRIAASHPEAAECFGTVANQNQVGKWIVAVRVPKFWGSEPVCVECATEDLLKIPIPSET